MTDKSTPTEPKKVSSISVWGIETDVAVVGFGGAGACAALEAADAGAQVHIFELASASGGSTAMSSAEIYMGGNGGTRVQKACGYQDSTENMVDFLKAAFGKNGDDDKIEFYAENSIGHFDWLVGMGVPFKDSELKERAIMALTDDCLLFTGNEKSYPFTEMADPVPRGHNLEVVGDNGGPLLMKILTEQIEKRSNIAVTYDSRALTLITNDSGTVEGVIVRIDQKEVAVRAKSVVLCAGGFCMNEDMVRRYAPMFSGGLEPLGNPGDTGSGILMGQGVGAGTVNMQECFMTIPFYPPESLTYGIFINDKGQRFINEDCYHGRVGYYALQQQRQSSKKIYLITDFEGYGEYERKSYLGAPVAGTGETIEELELELSLPNGSLAYTLNTYNSNAEKGEDPLFHKHTKWLRPLEAPFVALDCSMGFGTYYPFFTLGGLDTLPTGEVLTPERKVIPGLYAAGRTTAGIPRTVSGYASGMSVGDATFFGRMAGKNAAAFKQ